MAEEPRPPYSAGRSLWPDSLPPEYVVGVDRLRAGLAECPAFTRPQAAPTWRKLDSIFRGKLFTLSRVIDVSAGGPPRHIAAALEGHFPPIAEKWRGCLDIEPDLEVAINTATKLHSTKSLAAFRQRQGQTLAAGAFVPPDHAIRHPSRHVNPRTTTSLRAYPAGGQHSCQVDVFVSRHPSRHTLPAVNIHIQ